LEVSGGAAEIWASYHADRWKWGQGRSLASKQHTFQGRQRYMPGSFAFLVGLPLSDECFGRGSRGSSGIDSPGMEGLGDGLRGEAGQLHVFGGRKQCRYQR